MYLYVFLTCCKKQSNHHNPTPIQKFRELVYHTPVLHWHHPSWDNLNTLNNYQYELYDLYLSYNVWPASFRPFDCTTFSGRLTVNRNALRLFPSYIYFYVAHLRYIFFTENRTYYLPNAGQMRYLLRHRHGFLSMDFPVLGIYNKGLCVLFMHLNWFYFLPIQYEGIKECNFILQDNTFRWQ